MAINVVQAASGTLSISGANGTYTLTVTFTNPVTSGNTILVMLSEDQISSFPGISLSTITDTGGNSYTTVFTNWQPHSAPGPGNAFCFAPVVTGGSSFSVSIPFLMSDGITSNNLRVGALCIEMTGMPSVSAVSNYFLTPPLVSQGTPVVGTVTDSFGNTVSVTFNGTNGSGGPGVCALGAVVMLTSGINFLLAFVVNQAGTNLPTANHGYSFALTENVSPGATFHFFTPGLPVATVQQPQIFVVN